LQSLVPQKPGVAVDSGIECILGVACPHLPGAGCPHQQPVCHAQFQTCPHPAPSAGRAGGCRVPTPSTGSL